MKAHPKHDKIHEALELLNEVAQEKKEELWETIVEKYDHVREMAHEMADGGIETAEKIKDGFLKKIQEEEKKLAAVAEGIDKKVHKEPWKAIGGVAIASLVVGVLLGRK